MMPINEAINTQQQEPVTPPASTGQEKPATVIRSLRLIFGGDTVELIPSDQGNTLACACGRQTRFFREERNVPVGICTQCAMQRPAERRVTLGDVLLAGGLITTADIRRILDEQKKSGGRFGEIAVHLGLCTEKTVIDALCSLFRFEFIDLATTPIAEEEMRILNKELCLKHRVVVVGKKSFTFHVAMADPTDEQALVAVAQSIGRVHLNLKPLVALPADIEAKLFTYSEKSLELKKESLPAVRPKPARAVVSMPEGKIIDPKEAGEIDDTDTEEIPESESQSLTEDVIVAEYKRTLAEAFRREASDIHLEYLDSRRFLVRYRIDGLMHPPKYLIAQYGKMLNIIKVKSHIDVGDRIDKVYEGSFAVKYRGKNYRLRTVYLPAFVAGKCHPKCIIRIFNPESQAKNLVELGFDDRTLEILSRAGRQPHGMILAAGSTGTGKSTTLAAIMREKAEGLKLTVYSLENPVEYAIPGVNQIQIETSAKMKHRNYAAILPAIQRADPDVVLVGEIRNRQTAGAAYRMAIAGNLLLSTIHASDSPGVITRLRNFGIEPFIIGDTTRLIVSQRLIRKLCPACKTRKVLTGELIRNAGFFFPHDRNVELCEPSREGCESCTYGYRGRTVISEAMPVSPSIRDMIIERKNERNVRFTAIHEGMVTLRQSGLSVILDGATSIAEIQRVTGDFPDPTIEAMMQRSRSTIYNEDILASVATAQAG